MKAVRTHFSSDNRVASLSLGSGESNATTAIRCHLPFGNAFFVNLNLVELVGAPDQSGVPQHEIVSWAERANRRGLFNYWAPWLAVSEKPVIEISQADAMEVSDSLTPLGSQVLEKAKNKISLLIDCSWLGSSETGSQRATVETIKWLALNDRISRIDLFGLPNGIPDYAYELRAKPKINEIVLEKALYSDVLWRPYQPSGEVNFYELNRHARRIVFTYLDLIAYSNDAYHESQDSWLNYRSSLRLAAIRCDGIVAISQDVRNQILENMPMLNPDRVFSVPLGTDHIVASESKPNNERKISGKVLKQKTFLLTLGTNFAHKNRDFSIAVAERVRSLGHPVSLVFAGLILGQVNSGEPGQLAEQSGFPDWVMTLGSVSSEDRDWLLSNALVSLYPTSAEGFGLVPFESAASGVPVVATNFGPLSELLPDNSLIEKWDVEEYASAICEFLESSDSVDRQLREIGAASKTLTWKSCSEQLSEAFFAVSKMEKSPANVASAEFEAQFQKAQERFNVEVNAITSSISWKITSPIRSLHRRLTGR
jgi:glycosyltransferase involved in cell wall biosynthesis